MAEPQVVADVESADRLGEADRADVRDLILVLADSKRLLGMRYADWTLGAPELEAGIACASMAQDEWGHARQLYALLRDFGDDTEQIEHGRQPAEYRSMALLDEAPAGWPDLVVLNALADTALSVQFDALTASAYVPLRQRCEKLLDEERFHFAHGTAWFRRLAEAGDRAREVTREAALRALPGILGWFGPDGERSRRSVDAGLVSHGPDALRERYLERIAPLLARVEIRNAPDAALDGVDEASRRPKGTMPDAAVIEKLRGDRNRAFLMD